MLCLDALACVFSAVCTVAITRGSFTTAGLRRLPDIIRRASQPAVSGPSPTATPATTPAADIHQLVAAVGQLLKDQVAVISDTVAKAIAVTVNSAQGDNYHRDNENQRVTIKEILTIIAGTHQGTVGTPQLARSYYHC